MFEPTLQLVTPAVIGGAKAKEVDRWGPFRVPSLRGQIRWWFRAGLAGVLRVSEGVSGLLRREGPDSRSPSSKLVDERQRR